MTHATRISADHHAVIVTSNAGFVTDWMLRYFGPWWHATSTTDADQAERTVRADIDPETAEMLTRSVLDAPHEKAEYARAPMVHTRTPEGAVRAAQPDQQLAYEARPDGTVRIVGADEVAVALAAARLARESVRGQLLTDGWVILHASAVTRGNGAVLLTLGNKGAGKTTVALTLARQGLGLLANDRVFVRAAVDGTVSVLPWPSAAAVGLGLLNALGLYDEVRARFMAGDRLHPTQDQRVTDALLAGKRTPQWENGRELKLQFFPDQLATMLQLTLTTRGPAERFLFPQITPNAEPELLDDKRMLREEDFFTAASEDRYPDVFGLLPDNGGAGLRTAFGMLTGLPRTAFRLSHDAAANTDFLKALTAEE
ncbi:hypothetical protein GCM10010218_13260 [Streptomyces mashuensis]|uniref:Uncharacterized protein n=1 Tax=Streptomyces mashuensis TaxID=33904 RepID=A0A919AZQ7_9ACTN|nr:hypothetical protein [Streptomyces mashuensis]GHF33514.1 hypothetical protein GCM10010218_13260 [Streptomyces mashuensis]